jgi:protein involved in ribonucleotide reduction
MFEIVYFSNTSENTKRFIEKLDMQATRIPIDNSQATLEISQPYVLATPTYGRINNREGIPTLVKAFLNLKCNRQNLCGVIAAGNTNFGTKYCNAGIVISRKCKVPLIHKFELIGTPHDLIMVRERLEELWNQHEMQKK